LERDEVILKKIALSYKAKWFITSTARSSGDFIDHINRVEIIESSKDPNEFKIRLKLRVTKRTRRQLRSPTSWDSSNPKSAL
jgi:hypothetical protein